MIRRQFPARAIRRGFEPMSDANMPAQHLAAEAAVETDHIVLLHRAPDRHRRRPPFFRRRRAPETGERSPHFGNEARELIDADLVMLHIVTDNARDETRINLSCRATLCHRTRSVYRAALLYPTPHSFESGRYDFMKTLKCFPECGLCGVGLVAVRQQKSLCRARLILRIADTIIGLIKYKMSLFLDDIPQYAR